MHLIALFFAINYFDFYPFAKRKKRRKLIMKKKGKLLTLINLGETWFMLFSTQKNDRSPRIFFLWKQKKCKSYFNFERNLQFAWVRRTRIQVSCWKLQIQLFESSHVIYVWHCEIIQNVIINPKSQNNLWNHYFTKMRLLKGFT